MTKIRESGMMRGFLRIAVAIVLVTLAPAARSQTKSLKDQLVGDWQLVSVDFNGSNPYGSKPQGAMFVGADGRYSIIVIGVGKARTVAYFGTYTANDADNSVTLHIAASNFINGAGRDQKRFITFTGDELTLASEKSRGPIGPLKLTWKHAS